MKIPKKGERSKKLYRKVYDGFVCKMTDEPTYTWEEVKPRELKKLVSELFRSSW